MKKSLFVTILLFKLACVFSQSTVNVAVVGFFMPSAQEINDASNPSRFRIFNSDYNKITKMALTMESYVVEALVADQRFVVVERQKLNLIEKERELQKSESFIDGYVIQEGKNIDAEYLILGDFNPSRMELLLSLFSVVEQKTLVKKRVNLEPVLENNKSLRTIILQSTQEVMFKVFPAKILVVKELDGNAKKSKLVLISGGNKYGLNKNQELEAKIKLTEEVEGELLERLETVSVLSIKIVENENFSQCEVLEGGEKLKNYLHSNTKLFCYPRISD